MSRKLYDLAGADRTVRFSPFCWRAKLALKHKGLDFEEVDVAFTEKDKVAFSGQKLVPILVDDDKTIHDSWNIATYLDDAYASAPSLMADAQARAHAITIKHWVESAVHGPMIKVVLMDLYNRLAPVDQAYFRESRQARFGMTLEEFCAGEAGIPALQQSLQPIRMTLGLQSYLGGDAPSYADHLVMGALLWGRASSDIPFIADDDAPILNWLDRIKARYELRLKI